MYAELEIGLHRFQIDSLNIELRYTNPQSVTVVAPQRGEVILDLDELRSLQLRPMDYGRALTQQLFADESVRSMWGKAKVDVGAGGQYLRVRLWIGASAPDLHGLRWELLQDPESGDSLATSEKILFSRFITGPDWRRLSLRPKARLKALIAVSAPHDIHSKYQLAPIDAASEVERIRRSLEARNGDSPFIDTLGHEQPMTLDRLIGALRAQPDIVYLVCHGRLDRKGIPRLYFQDEQGNAEVVSLSGTRPERDLVRRIRDLREPPRLMVLASCESAGMGDHFDSSTQQGRLSDPNSTIRGHSAHAALAPRLAEAGVPAIIAMQGKVSMETIEAAMPEFFSQLLHDGQIDRALAAARGKVRGRPDHWMPALYSRLKSGRIWYEPGFAGESREFEKWKTICRRVRKGQVIPILGPDFGEHVLGRSEELARRLAREENFPLAEHDRSDLARVAQYVRISQDDDHLQDGVVDHLRRQLLDRNGRFVNGAHKELPELLHRLSQERSRIEDDPYRLLTRLNASIYINAGVDTLLIKTLKAVGRDPTPLICRWRPSSENHPCEPAYDGRPAPEHPIVYQVFGVLAQPESLVLAEDDFFDFLIHSSRYRLIPKVVRGSLASNSLVFLGFALNSWTFRVLFRLIMTQEGSPGLRRFSHVGVQVDPEEYSLADVERARRYLERYFGKDRCAGLSRGEPGIDIYWGTPGDFLAELGNQLDRTETSELPAVTVAETSNGWY